MRILLVEDDPQLGRITQIGLEQLGMTVDWLQRGETVLSAVATHDYACLLLDLGLQTMDGMQLLRSLRRGTRAYQGAILIVTARDQIPDRIAGLDEGADDFIIKPFDLDELAARIRAACRRSHGRLHEILQYGELTLDVAAREVRYQGQVVALTGKEFCVLQYLMERRGQVVTREQLEEALYGWGEEIESNAVQVHIHHLRKKISKHCIRTVHALGYTMAAEGDA